MTTANRQNQPNIMLATTQQPHTRTRHNWTSHDKTRPTGNKSRRGRPTATKRCRPGPYRPPHKPGQADHWQPRRRRTNTTRRAPPRRNAMSATSDRPATANLRTNREDNKDNVRLHRHGLQRNRTHDAQADHEAANITAYQPTCCRKNDPTRNRQHAGRPTANQPGMQGSKRERRPMGWRHHDAHAR